MFFLYFLFVYAKNKTYGFYSETNMFECIITYKDAVGHLFSKPLQSVRVIQYTYI